MNVVRHFFRRFFSYGLLSSAAHACMLLASPAVVAQDENCKSVAPVTLSAFRETVGAFAKSAATSAMLLDLKKSNKCLAETLMLFQSRLNIVAEVERAFLHYVINSGEQNLDGEETANLERLARTYLESLLLSEEQDEKARDRCDRPPWTLRDLQCVGRSANRERYGRDDVVPVDLIKFEPSYEGYLVRNATWMAQMSALAYQDKALVGQQLKGWGFTLVSEIKDRDTDTNGFIASRGNVLVVAFRGTSSFRDFITDGDIRRVSPEWGVSVSGKVHSGFNNALDKVWPQLIEELAPPLKAHPMEIWLTGHSLGGALAQLAALRLTLKGYSVRRVYTFGTPLIGDEKFVADYDQRLGKHSYPHVNNKDVVARVPPGLNAAASANTRQFTGWGHELKVRPDWASEAGPVQGDWRKTSADEINKTTAFLPVDVRPRALVEMVPVAESANSYSAEFKTGSVDDHGSFQYSFKLVCASIDYDLWRSEIQRSGPNPPDLPREPLR